MSNKPAARASASKNEPPAAPPPYEPVEHAAYAYAIVEGPPGKWSAVMLEGVTARKVTCIEPNGQPEPQARAMMRIQSAISQRTIAKKWGRL